MAHTKLVSTDESTCQDVADWIDTQLELPNSDMQTWAIPIPRDTDTKFYIKKHPTLSMNGCSVAYVEEDWIESWIIPSVEE